MNNRSTGAFYEGVAVNYLEENGVKIIARNVHCGRFGEIDLIGEDDSCLIFIECKYRSNDRFGKSIEAVNAKKMAVIRKCARYYLLKHPTDKYLRFDVVGFDNDEVTWIKNAF